MRGSGRGEPLIFARRPALRGRIAWMALADALPTAIEPLVNLGRRLGIPRLYVKRDDRTSTIYGGNKVRKLEWVLARARELGRKEVVTLGAWGSHHALATAVFAREAGLGARLLLYPQPPTPHVRENLLADLGVGARVVALRSIVTAPLALAAAAVRRAFYVAPGGSDARGTLGYVECALEIADAVRAGAAPAPDFVHVAAGTCGTAAGLALGLALAAEEVPALASARVVGVGVVPAFVASPGRVRHLVRGAARLLEFAGAPADVTLLRGHLGRGYGFETDEARDLAAAALADESLALDTTYTAKTLAGLRAFARERADKVHLYVHTLNAADVAPLAARGDPARLPARLRDVQDEAGG